MAQCPACHSVLDADFGVVICPQCTAAVFFDLDGNSHIESNTNHGFDISSPQPVQEYTPLSDYSENSLQEESPQPEETPYDFESSMDVNISKNEPLISESSFNEEIQSHADSIDITGLTYSLTLKGIDSAELKSQVKDIISDSRFNLNLKEQGQQIIKGILILEKINPVKVALLVQKLKKLPISIEWTQHEI